MGQITMVNGNNGNGKKGNGKKGNGKNGNGKNGNRKNGQRKIGQRKNETVGKKGNMTLVFESRETRNRPRQHYSATEKWATANSNVRQLYSVWLNLRSSECSTGNEVCYLRLPYLTWSESRDPFNFGGPIDFRHLHFAVYTYAYIRTVDCLDLNDDLSRFTVPSGIFSF